MKVTPVRAASAGFKNDSLGVSNDTIFIIVCSISMKYSEAMNPDKGVRSTRCAHWCRRYCWWQQVCSIYAGKHAHIQPSFSLTCPAFSSNTHMKERACLCVSPSRVVEPCYSTCVFFCSDAAMLPQFSHAQPPKLHADPHRLPAGSLRHGENNGERRKRATVEIERETRQEVKPGQAESRVTKKIKIVKGLVEETRD